MKVILVRVVFLLLLTLVVGLKVDPVQTDYITYWCAGHRLVRIQDPYNTQEIGQTERALGVDRKEVLVMRNPPWALFATIPIAWAGPRLGFLIWTFMISGALFCSLYLFGIKDWVLPLLFAPVMVCFDLGQTSIFLLLGFALFLYLHEKHPFLAGISLLLVMFKPHLFILFGVILILDCVRRRNVSIVLGAATAVIISSLFALAFDPHVFAHYIASIQVSHLEIRILPALPTVIRFVIHPQWVWIQFVPLGMGLGFAVWYYIRNRNQWNWREHGMPLVMVGVLTSPYEWLGDEVLFVPVLMKRLGDPDVSTKAKAFIIAVNTFVVLLTTVVNLGSGAFMWTTATWCLWYLYSGRVRNSPAKAVQLSNPS